MSDFAVTLSDHTITIKSNHGTEWLSCDNRAFWDDAGFFRVSRADLGALMVDAKADGLTVEIEQ